MPSFATWKEYQYRLPTVEEWKRWFADALCIVCGVVSGNLRVIDFDQKGKAFEAFKTKCPKELFDRLVIETSQSGGYHVIFRTESEMKVEQKLARDADGKTLIETLGEGKLFLCAPTPGYELIQSDFQHIPVLKESEADTLFELAWGCNEYQELSPSPPLSPKRSAPLPMTGTRPGDALNENGIGFIREILQKHGWKYVGQRGDNDEKWQRPGTNDGHSAYLHITPPVFYPFSTNSHPFESDKTYSYFAVYATLEHGGDFSAATKELAGQGYGDALVTEPVELNEFITDPPRKEDEDGEGDEENDDCSENFPAHLLNVPGFVNDFAQYVNSVSHVEQPTYSLAVALALQALLCAQNVKDPTGIRTNPYIIVAGRSSSGKDKGREVIKKVFTQLENIHAYKNKHYKPLQFVIEGVASEPALIRYLGINHGALLWLWDEMGKELPTFSNDSFRVGIPTTLMRLYTSADSIFFPHVRADQKNSLPTIQQPCLVLYGTAEKETLYNAFSVSALTDGLLGRLMIFEGNDSAKRRKQTEQLPIPENILDTTNWWLEKRAENINQEIPQPIVVPVTSEAEEIFDQFHNIQDTIQNEKNRVKDALWGRSQQQARQFALVYACSIDKENPVVDQNAAQWAYELVSYLIKRKVYIAKSHVADSEFDRQQKEIVRYFEECGGQCEQSMFTRKFQRLEKRRRDDIIANLKDAGVIREERRQKEGSQKYAVFYVLVKKKKSSSG